MVVETDHTTAGPNKAIGCPVHFSETPAAITRAAPLLGEHTRELLAGYGYSEDEIDRFVADGVVESAT
jgi:crotonobetainyl-CoA:carnitine CoA-transferase CaiB-like acyl-CoA transferase